MSKPQIHAIWKVADILNDSISLELVLFLQKTYIPDFQASDGDDDIFNVSEILASADTDYEATPECKLIREELEAIQKVISKKGCSYFRIVG